MFEASEVIVTDGCDYHLAMATTVSAAVGSAACVSASAMRSAAMGLTATVGFMTTLESAAMETVSAAESWGGMSAAVEVVSTVEVALMPTVEVMPVIEIASAVEVARVIPTEVAVEAVTPAPPEPRANADEDAVVEVIGGVVAVRCACVWGIRIVAVGTIWRWTVVVARVHISRCWPYADANSKPYLSVRGRRSEERK